MFLTEETTILAVSRIGKLQRAKSKLDARKPFDGSWAKIVLGTCTIELEALATTEMMYCKQAKVEIKTKKIWRNN